MNNKSTTNNFIYASAYVIWLLMFVIAPLVLLLFQSLTDANNQLTLDNFIEYFKSPTYLQMTFNSIIYAFLVTAVTFLISYPTAYILSRLKSSQFWLLLVILPTWINLLLKTYAFIGLLSHDGTINSALSLFGFQRQQLLFSDWSFLMVASYIEIPFMILPIFNSLTEIDSNLIAASRDLGASNWQTLRRVIFPLSTPGVKAGVQAVFIPSLSLFMITRLIAGNRVITLGTAIEEHFLVTQNWHLGATIGVILIIAMMITMFFTRDREVSRGTRQ